MCLALFLCCVLVPPQRGACWSGYLSALVVCGRLQEDMISVLLAACVVPGRLCASQCGWACEWPGWRSVCRADASGFSECMRDEGGGIWSPRVLCSCLPPMRLSAFLCLCVPWPMFSCGARRSRRSGDVCVSKATRKVCAGALRQTARKAAAFRGPFSGRKKGPKSVNPNCWGSHFCGLFWAGKWTENWPPLLGRNLAVAAHPCQRPCSAALTVL